MPIPWSEIPDAFAWRMMIPLDMEEQRENDMEKRRTLLKGLK